MIIVGQETGVPVVQVAGMENALAVGLYHPRHAAVVASGGRHAEEFVFPRGTFPQPGVGFFLLRPTVFQDIFRKDVAHVRFPGLPGKDVAVEMVFVEMAGKRRTGAWATATDGASRRQGPSSSQTRGCSGRSRGRSRCGRYR